MKITIDTDGERGSDTAEVTATDGHPFWVPELGEWIDATDLRFGQWLRTSAGTHVQITAIERWTTPQATVHNLTVANIHTYYVVAGGTPVLGHNTSCPTEYFNTYDSDGSSGVIASIDSDGILNTAIQAGDGTPNGAKMFEDALEALGPRTRGIRGKWVAGDMQDNLDSFNSGIQVGLDPEKAAMHTFTGKMAARNGFTRATIERTVGSIGEYTNVQVVFWR